MYLVFGIPGFSTDTQSAEGKLVLKAIQKCANKVGGYEFRPGAVAFRIDNAFARHSSDLQNAAALRTLMNCLVELNIIWLRFHPSTLPLYQTPVYYRRTTLWDTIPCLYARGWGDCKSLAACRVAENHRNKLWCRSVFRFLPGKSSIMFHILLMYADGTWEDPSKALGMVVSQENPDHPSSRVRYG